MKNIGALILSAACLTALHTSALADTWDGGSGTWDNGITADWNNGGTWTNGDSAYFLSSPGLVQVNNTNGGPVSFGYFEVNSSAGTLDFEGDPLTTTSPYFNIDSGNQATVNFGSTIQEDASVGGFHFSNSSSQNLVLNNLTMTGTAGNFGEFHADTFGTGEIIFNGTITPGTGGGKLMFSEYGGGNGLYEVNGDVSALTAGLEISGGTVLLGANVNLGANALSAFSGNTVAHGFLTNGAMTVNNSLSISNGALGMFGGNTGDVSTFSGNFSVYDDSDLELTAQTGGRVNFTGNIGGEIKDGFIKTGNGTVVLGNNNYAIGTGNTNSGTVAADIQSGTVLANSTGGGSAFGNNNGQVKVEAGATLGGSGGTTGGQLVVAEAPTLAAGNAVIAPGDAGDAAHGIAPTIATLTLAGGLEADNGLTMDFKLDGGGNTAGVDNDLLTVHNLTLNGPVTINLFAIGSTPLQAGTTYQIIDGDGTWTTAPDITVNGPAGFTATYDYDPTSYALTVTLAAAPEPSTWAMMIGGLALLGFCVRRRLA